MSAPTFAIITPTFAPDLERCRLLVRSVQKFVSPAVTHYLVVDQRDLPLFRQCAGPRTHLMEVESVLPARVMRLPFARRWWFSLKTPPIRNWILQQVVKIAMAQHLPEEVMVLVDSDVTFIRAFSLLNLICDDRVRLFVVPGRGEIASHIKWRHAAAQLLGLPATAALSTRYVGNLISWRRDNVLKLQQHIERISGKCWLDALCWQGDFSEYILYGLFVDHVLQGDAGHYHDASPLCLEHWEDVAMSDTELEAFLSRAHSAHAAVMISAKAGIPVTSYEHLIDALEVVHARG